MSLWFSDDHYGYWVVPPFIIGTQLESHNFYRDNLAWFVLYWVWFSIHEWQWISMPIKVLTICMAHLLKKHFALYKIENDTVLFQDVRIEKLILKFFDTGDICCSIKHQHRPVHGGLYNNWHSRNQNCKLYISVWRTRGLHVPLRCRRW